MIGKNRRHGAMVSEETKLFLRSLATVRDEAARQGIDMERHLDDLRERSDLPEWRTSIVALLETLGFNAAPKRRQELAKDLGFTGSLDATGSMGIWLHGEVMMRLRSDAGRTSDGLSAG
jgi:hypothetical protein